MGKCICAVFLTAVLVGCAAKPEEKTATASAVDTSIAKVEIQSDTEPGKKITFSGKEFQDGVLASWKAPTHELLAKSRISSDARSLALFLEMVSAGKCEDLAVVKVNPLGKSGDAHPFEEWTISACGKTYVKKVG